MDTIKSGEEAKPSLNSTHASVNSGSDSKSDVKNDDLKKAISQVATTKPLPLFGTFKRDPNDKNSESSNISTLKNAGARDPEVVEIVPVTHVYELPRTQSRYVDLEPVTEGPTEEITPVAPLSPMSELSSIDDVTMDPLPSDNSDSNQHIEDVPAGNDTNVITAQLETPSITPEAVNGGERPKKRPRQFLGYVEVPSITSIYGKRNIVSKPATEPKVEYDKKIGKLVNPKVKRQQNLVLNADTVMARLDNIPKDPYPIPLEAAKLWFEVTREFLSHVYGGSAIGTFPSISKEKFAIHGLADFMYPSLNLNPYAPEVPGAPGLFFVADNKPAGKWRWALIQRVIVRLASAKWQYMGQYRMEPATSLTKEEWAAQKPIVRNTWAREICRKKWGIHCCARIYLRKTLTHEPTEAELEEELEVNRKYTITPEEVDAAFLRGEESIAIWTMECIGFDVDFQLNLLEKFPDYVPVTRNLKGKGAGKKTAGTSDDVQRSRAGKKKAGEKRKRDEVESSAEDEVESSAEDEDGDDPEEKSPEDEAELVYRSRGTRSRPINIF